MVKGQGGAEGATGVPGSGLNPDAVERALALQPGVGDAVEGHATGEAEVFLARQAVQRVRQAQDDVLGDLLDGGGEIAVGLCHRLGRAAGRAEENGEALVGHRLALEKAEVGEIQPEGTVGLQVHQLVTDQVGEARPAVGREAHELVFAGVDAEAGVVGEGRVEQAERVGKFLFLQQLDLSVATAAERGGRPFADAVEREDGGARKRRREERARGVRLVVAAEMHRHRPAAQRGEFVLDDPRQPELVVEPVRHRGGEGAEAARGDGEGRGQDALELQQRFLVVDRGVDGPAGLGQAPGGGVAREGGVVLETRETFLLRGGDDHAVLEQDGRGVVVESAEPEQAHQNWRSKRRGPAGGGRR